MKFFRLLALCLIPLAFRANTVQGSSNPDTRPNLILILADDLGWADLGCYGNQYNESPRIDQLAAMGMRWTQFYAGPVCSPTRANIQSGQDQARFGITQHIPGHRRPFAKLRDPEVPRQLPLEVTTFAELLGKAGYKTGYFGKWHLGGTGFGPKDQGWQTAVETQGNTLSPAMAKVAGTDRMAEYLTNMAVDFIEQNRDQPFLLQVSHTAVHIPLSTTKSRREKYQQKPAASNYPSRPDYAGLIEELDESVGRILDTIERLQLSGRTLIIFTSDNGGLETEQNGTITTSNKPLRREKGTLYEGGIRVPMIACWQNKVQPGTKTDEIASTIDLFATFADLAGCQLPKTQPNDGISLKGVLQDASCSLPERALFWHLPHYHHSTPASAIRMGGYKLLEFHEDHRLELYDLNNDIGESTNLSVTRTDMAARLHTALQTWRHQVGARMPEPNPDYDAERSTELAKPNGGVQKKEKRRRPVKDGR
ncbi:MAG: sulfatase [Planctomycetaceae bacterium]